MVDAHDKGGRAVILGGGGDHHLFRTPRQVDRRLFRGVVRAGGLDDVLRAAVVPVELRRVALTVYPDLLAIEDQMPVVPLHAALERPEYGVIFHLIDHIIQIRVPQVDPADLIAAAAPLHHDPQCHTADPPKAVDTHFDSHNPVFLPVLIFCRQFRQALALL